MKSITENTKLNVTMLLLILGGYGFILGAAHSADVNAKDIVRVEMKQAEQESEIHALSKISTDIEVIKVKLEIIEQRLPRQAGRGR